MKNFIQQHNQGHQNNHWKMNGSGVFGNVNKGMKQGQGKNNKNTLFGDFSI